MKKAVCIIAAVMAVCLTSFALADETDKFLGKWVCYSVIVDGKAYTVGEVEAEVELAVRTDGTASVFTKFEHIQDEYNGAWLAEGNDIIVTDGSSYILFTMNADGDLVLSAQGAEFILKHVNAVEINETNFPDEKFRGYVELNRDYFRRDRLLTEDEIKATKDIYVANRDIGDLTGIEYFTEIKQLDCSNNHLTNLDLSKNTKLTELNCSNNQLTDLNVKKSTKLKEIYCSDNQLSQIDVSKNTALTILSCGSNRLTGLNVKKNKKLERLYCGNNQLTAIDVSKNTKLLQIDCYNNQLTAIDLSHNAKLYGIECGGNRLAAIDLSQNPEMSYVMCAGNRLTKLDLSKNPKMEIVFCEDNQLANLDLSRNPGLRDLRCDGNPITKLDLSKHPLLRQLRCSGCRLTSLNLTKNTKLEELDCSNNYLAALDLSKNKALTDYHLTCDGNQAQVGTKDGKITFKSLSGFKIGKVSDIRFTADAGSGTVKKGKTVFTVKKSGVITYTYALDASRGLSRTFSIKVDFLKPEITTVTLRKKSYAYTGSPIEPTMTVKAKVDGKAVKLSASDYTVTYENNVEAGTATVIVEGRGSYGGRIKKTFTITPVKILKVTLSKYELPYNGKQRKPVPTVTAKVGGQLVTLEKDRDYAVKYENNKQPGTATVTITGKDNYSGTITKTFTIMAPEE